MVVNLYGQSAYMDPIMALCDAYGVPDGGRCRRVPRERLIKASPSGSFGKLAAFSFNGNKIITTSGGGMLVSDDEDLIKRARFLSTQARDPAPHYEHSVIGYNYRMSNILAGVGSAGSCRCWASGLRPGARVFEAYARRPAAMLRGSSGCRSRNGAFQRAGCRPATIDPAVTGIDLALN